MTVQEFYDFAKKDKLENCEIFLLLNGMRVMTEDDFHTLGKSAGFDKTVIVIG